MNFFKKFYEKYLSRDKLSESAVLIGRAFDEENDDISFFDSVLARFDNFDQMNRIHGNKGFSDDVEFIVECVTASLSSTELSQKFPNRIDSYLYMFRRIEEYLIVVKQKSYWTRSLENNIKKLKDAIIELATKIFITNKGLQPNLSTNNKELLKKMNIIQYLLCISKIDGQTINTFFVMSKLSLQSSKLIDDQLQWKHIIANIKEFSLTFQEFIAKYIDYELAFREFQLDLSGFLELVRSNHPTKQSPESPFTIFMRLCRLLNLSTEDFFEQYRIIFENRLKQKCYVILHISEFLIHVGRHDRIFGIYFSTYADNVDLDNLWNMSVYLCINSELNEIIQKHLTSKLTYRTMNAPMNDFLRYTKLSREAKTQMKEIFRPRFLTIFEKIFDTFIGKQLNEDQYYYLFNDSELKELLKIGLEMSSTQNLQQASCLLIIRRLLFQKDVQQLKIPDRIKDLFKKLNDFDRDLCENNDPIFIIQDEWLQNHLLAIPDDFTSRINKDDYQYLCDHHQNNRWTIYIWKRLIQLSIFKSKTEDSNNMLLKINDWMNLVKHNIYDLSDTLTNIFVICLFETIIFKNIKSVLSLPNIPLIIDFILRSRQDQLYQLDFKLVDEFIQNGKETIRQILTLQGKSEISKHISIIHFRKLCKIS